MQSFYTPSNFYSQGYIAQTPMVFQQAPPQCVYYGQSLENGLNSLDSDKENFDAPNFKTRLCKHFSRSGWCPKGDYCGFAHGLEELQSSWSNQAPNPSNPLDSEPSTVNSSSDDEAPSIPKTRLCWHFSQNGWCPKSTSCGFAHGLHELQDTQKVLKKKAVNAKHKSKLCDHYAKGGSMDCPYRCRCLYVHREDKEYFSKFFADTEEFNRKQTAFKERVQEQHRLKTAADDVFIDAQILRMVKAWNRVHPRGPNYFDFHGLTTRMAEQYLEEILDAMLASDVREARIETGRGKHSAHGFAAIRATILSRFQGHKGAHFAPEVGNDGVLVLTFPGVL